VGFVFIYAGWEKIVYPADFAVAIQNYQIIPSSMTNLVAIFLPWLEFYCGLILIFGFWHRAGAVILSTLLIIFIFALLSVFIRGLDIDCGCFGRGTSVGWSRIIEDLFLLFFALQIVFFPLSKLALENVLKKTN
jgi:uncharacterized membrane protein YphA (DoxX/SURF4 family)